MSDRTLSDLLNEMAASSDVVQQGFRLYLAELTDDLPTTRMKDTILAESNDAPRLSAELASMEHSSQALEEAALYFLSQAWDDPTQRDSIRECLEEANSQLPVIEVAILSIVAMYGMHLLATKGVATRTRRVDHRPDGSFTEEETVETDDPTTWLKALLGLFARPPG